jgi:hypothetical protein
MVMLIIVVVIIVGDVGCGFPLVHSIIALIPPPQYCILCANSANGRISVPIIQITPQVAIGRISSPRGVDLREGNKNGKKLDKGCD